MPIESHHDVVVVAGRLSAIPKFVEPRKQLSMTIEVEAAEMAARPFQAIGTSLAPDRTFIARLGKPARPRHHTERQLKQ
ncbi:hypothetical protein [Sphaerisporangium sp. NPDC051011]|uniref:hypothetical protein n=1 Tax=Sphaerisporangium sp. NPDC051011 TaxID=3155792 RepID=UPI0033CE71E4